MSQQSSVSTFTLLACLSALIMILGIVIAWKSYEPAPGIGVDFGILNAPLWGMIIGFPIIVVFSIIAMIRKEPYSIYTLFLVVPIVLVARYVFLPF